MRGSFTHIGDGILAYASKGWTGLMVLCVLRWQIALRAMSIASEICVYTNSNFVTEVIDGDKKKPE
jgi:ATP-dependent protease HslVU (ClpYQ) peptidase subunit